MGSEGIYLERWKGNVDISCIILKGKPPSLTLEVKKIDGKVIVIFLASFER